MQHSYTLGMRKYLDIPLTVIVTTVIIAAMFWPLEAVPPAPEWADKLVHFMAFAALAFPAGPHWTLRPAASVYWHERFWRHY